MYNALFCRSNDAACRQRRLQRVSARNTSHVTRHYLQARETLADGKRVLNHSPGFQHFFSQAVNGCNAVNAVKQIKRTKEVKCNLAGDLRRRGVALACSPCQSKLHPLNRRCQCAHRASFKGVYGSEKYVFVCRKSPWREERIYFWVQFLKTKCYVKSNKRPTPKALSNT